MVMEYVEWREILLRQARLHRMCMANRDALSLCQDKSQAIALYKNQIDWALECDYPPIDIIRKEFSESNDDGIFVDRKFDGELLKDQQVYVFHHCSGKILVDLNVSKRLIPMIYLANDCNMTIERVPKVSAHCITVPIYSFGENKIVAKDTDFVSFKVFNFEIKG